MKIAILNRSFLSEQQIDKLKKYGEVDVYSMTETEDELIERLKGAELAVADCWDAPLSRRVFENAPSLKYLSINSTGYDLADIKAARENNVSVANVPGFSTDSVAELTLALLLAVVRRIPKSDEAMRKEPFQVDSANRAYDIYRGQNLRGKTIGIVGLGRIGQRVAEIAKAFGMEIIGYNRTPKEIDGIRMASLEELFKQSDVISLNAALGDENKDLINKETIALMKDGVYLVNTARGAMINENDLYEALKSKKIAGAGLDVVDDWSLKNPLLQLDNVVLTPHSGFFTDESLQNMTEIIVANLESYINGSPQNVVNT